MKKSLRTAILTGSIWAVAQSASHAAIVVQQNFDTDPVNFILPGASNPFRFDPNIPSKYFAPSNTPGMTLNAGITGNATTYLAVQNIDVTAGDAGTFTGFSTTAPAMIDFTVNIGTLSDLKLSIDLAGMPNGEVENYVRAKTDNDGDGTYETTIFNFVGAGNNTPYTDSFSGQAMSANFQTFSNFFLPTPTAADRNLRFRLEIFNDTESLNEAQGIDNILIEGSQLVVGRNLVYNRTHTVGGAPNGSLQTTGNYFLEGVTPTAFAANDVVNFSQDGSALIDVPADVTAGGVVVSHNTGTYTIGGVGKIRGPFTKSNGGTVVFTSPNNFSGSTITGGIVETQAGALGAGSVMLSGGGIWKVTTFVQTQNGGVGATTGGGTVQTDVDLTATGVEGDGLLTKTGAGALILNAGGSGTGGINVLAGKLSLRGAVGAGTETISMNGNLLEFINTGEITFSDANNPRVINLGSGPGNTQIAVTNAGAGVIIGGLDGLVSGGTITKSGLGALRMAGTQNLTSNWVVNEGTLEARAGSPLGTGTVTVNAGARIAGQTTPVSNNIILAGGELATRGGDATDYQGSVTVTASSTAYLRSYTTNANPQDIRISGVLSGSGDLTVLGNAGSTRALILTNSGNTFTGQFLVSTGQTLSSEPLFGVVGPGTPLNARPVTLSGATLRIRDDGAGDNGNLAYGNNITVDTADSTLDVSGVIASGNTVQFGTLSIGAQNLIVNAGSNYKTRFAGATTLNGNATFTPNGTAELALGGAISGTFGLTMAGSGKLALDGVNTYTGSTTVATGTLGGIGKIAGSLTVAPGATLAPGNGPGTFSIDSDVTLNGGAILSLDISHGGPGAVRPGIDYDVLAVGAGIGAISTGAVSLTGAELTLTIGAGIVPNDLFFVLLNDGIDPINGTFNNLPNGSVVISGGQTFQISYTANSAGGQFQGGNDIALLAIPEPGSAALVTLGSALFLRRRPRKQA